MAEKFTTSEVVSFLTAERDCPFISSSLVTAKEVLKNLILEVLELDL